ncbi:MAG TPA: cation:proton antiporter [Pirellulaceae bacterium]|nr:cation:proton antiporter [Pirellulaceae bacterium]
MEPVIFLRDLLMVFAVAAAVVFLFHRLRIPAVVGLLVAGVLIGPSGLSLIRNDEHVRTLSEVGIVVLLFAVGLEFSLPRLVGMGRLMVQIGLPQVLVCGISAVAATWWYFDDLRPAIVVGMLVAMSSTAVAFKLLTDRGELGAPHGNIAAAVLLFQDLLVVVCMVLLPVLTTGQRGAGPSLWQSLVMGTVVVAALLVVGRFVVPALLFQVVRTQNRELFLMLLVLLCLGSAYLTASMGWSLALGAFIAGLALSESEYATQTLAEALPFRDTLSSLFFISVGMLLDLSVLWSNLPLVLATVVALMVLKFAAAALPALLAGYPLRTAVLAGAALAQIGEFSFILADRALALGILTRGNYQIFLAAAVLTITLTPLLMALAPRLADLLSELALAKSWAARQGTAKSGDEVLLNDHVIIVGYGLNGRNLARVLQAVDISHVILDLNPETVRKMRQRGEPLYYGDAARPAVLEHLGIRRARLLVVAISDPASTRRTVQMARQMKPGLHIIVRTRYLAEVTELRKLGADVIIPEEFETSVEIFAQVLRAYDVPRNLISDLIERVRGDHYEVLRDTNLPAMQVVLPHLDILQKVHIETCLLHASSPATGQTLGEFNLRARSGATLLAVRRGRDVLINPEPELRFEPGDTIVLMGEPPQVQRALALFELADGQPVE